MANCWCAPGALILVVLIAAFVWIRNVTREEAKKDSALDDARRIFSAPFATALLLARD